MGCIRRGSGCYSHYSCIGIGWFNGRFFAWLGFCKFVSNRRSFSYDDDSLLR
jgi:hypothetical protein